MPSDWPSLRILYNLSRAVDFNIGVIVSPNLKSVGADEKWQRLGSRSGPRCMIYRTRMPDLRFHSAKVTHENFVAMGEWVALVPQSCGFTRMV